MKRCKWVDEAAEEGYCTLSVALSSSVHGENGEDDRSTAVADCERRSLTFAGVRLCAGVISSSIDGDRAGILSWRGEAASEHSG